MKTKEAVARVAELSSVDGIFLGPGDLSSSLGVTGEMNHPLVRQAMHHALTTAKQNGKRVAGAQAVLEAIGDARARRD